MSFRLPAALLAQIDRLANDERRTRGNAIRLLLRGIAGADEMKYRAYILELSRTVRCLGEFDSEEKAQTAIDRCACFRVRVNSLRVSYVSVLESLPAD